MDLSERIEQLREAKNIRKADMAKALEMDPSYYNKFEKRGNKLSIEQVEQIASTLGVSLVELITGNTQNVEDDSQVKNLEKRVLELEAASKKTELLETLRIDNLHSVLLFQIIRFCDLNDIELGDDGLWENYLTEEQIFKITSYLDDQTWPKVLYDMGLIKEPPKFLIRYFKQSSDYKSKNKKIFYQSVNTYIPPQNTSERIKSPKKHSDQ